MNGYAAFTVNKERFRFALKHYVKIEHLDVGRGHSRIKVQEVKETNDYLEQVKFTITTYYQQLQIARER
ncbi:hypothetical protein DYU05_06270 [Mucilaginibacter terrenus]|uniref:Arm DNA-binding domain-containing protein n=1 Tax=Mucilaginibacter terrenus TaxID=2482727 RepID=A0A3E2NW13_9SPHI|nr:Arm DNA-binding domain-containing protein [Mucilaginibacter terrenus]RFZ85203.1 hypothetical protein DYU05_06270 [Mucilaginibacter terrenus]